MAEERLFAGFDGGGTKTACALCSESGELLGLGAGGPSNYLYCGRELAAASVREALGSAFAAAGMERRNLAAAYVASASIRMFNGAAHEPFFRRRNHPGRFSGHPGHIIWRRGVPPPYGHRREHHDQSHCRNCGITTKEGHDAPCPDVRRQLLLQVGPQAIGSRLGIVAKLLLPTLYPFIVFFFPIHSSSCFKYADTFFISNFFARKNCDDDVCSVMPKASAISL